MEDFQGYFMNIRFTAMTFFLIMSGWLCAEQQIITRPDGSSVTITLMKGDIVQQQVDIIVNAANKELVGGTGVNGAIRKAAPSITSACEQFPLLPGGIRCPVGDVRITSAYELTKNGVKYIAHAVGPDCRIPEQEQHKKELLRDVYYNSIHEACELNAHTIAFCSLSTGVYSYDVKEAAQIALQIIRKFITNYPRTISLTEIRFVLWNDADLDAYTDALRNPQQIAIPIQFYNELPDPARWAVYYCS